MLLRWLNRLSPALTARLLLSRFLKPHRRELDAVDATLLAQAQRRWLRCEGQRIQVYAWGEGPRTVVLLHGWGSHGPRYSCFVEGILARGWRAVAFDAPGHGQSSGRHSSLDAFQHALDAVIDHCGGADALIGHSFGALAILSRLREPSPQPAAAVLISTPRDLGYLLDSFLTLTGADAALCARVRDGFAARFGHAATDYSATELAAGVIVPTLIVHDRDDDVVPVDHAQELSDRLPRSSMHLTQGLGHSGLLRDPATVGAILGFLDGALQGASALHLPR